ncbi:uncharacterized protein LOC120353668 [Nilaparvata lugens]|uniref:uncharacterized protein LOC120353668 n=1 Tax=Nilaparvata lugens TaxID=108931 RepID=UPI00193E221E|nr:uncharacterized protein LOC120353668 [Nilaparvata lugens]
MHKFVSSLFGFSAVVIFILQLHVNGVCARHITFKQPRDVEKGIDVVITLLPPEDSSRTQVIRSNPTCVRMSGSPHDKATPRFSIKANNGDDLTERWELAYEHPTSFHKCTTEDISFYRIEALYWGEIKVSKVTYPEEGVKVEKLDIRRHFQGPIKWISAQLTFTYYRSLENDARDEVKLAKGVKVTLRP